jgi:DNA repair protein RadC
MTVNTPAMLLAARCADQGVVVPIEIMHGALEQLPLEALSATLTERLEQKFEGRDLICSWELLLDYLKSKLAPLQFEQVQVLFLDTKNRLIADEVHARGTINECPIHIRNVIHRALDLGASAIILAHNHPSGDPTPSAQDIKFTKDLQSATRHLGIVLHDHVIVGGANTPTSMRAGGFLK